MYFITLSFAEENAKWYTPIIDRMKADKRHKKLLITKQYGSSGNHEHYHIMAETDEESISKYRMRYRSYFKKDVEINQTTLEITTMDVPGKLWNYVKRDPSTKVLSTGGWDMEKLQRQALAHPDPVGKSKLPWCQLSRKLKMAGWKYPERPGKYLRKISEFYSVDHIVTNPKRLSMLLRFHNSKDADDWDDVYVHQDNVNEGLFARR